MRTRHALALVVVIASAANAQVGDEWLGPDKALHFTASAGIAGVTWAGVTFVSDELWVRVVTSTAVALAAGLGKELLDLAGLGQPSWKDLAWDALGTFTSVVTALLLDRLLVEPLGRIPVW